MSRLKLVNSVTLFFILGFSFIFPESYAGEKNNCSLDCKKKKALLGDGKIAYLIGNDYLYKSREDMKYWYRISSENGNVDGQYNYAHFLAADSKSPEDCFRAIYWFKAAADQGDLDSKMAYLKLKRSINSGELFQNGCASIYDAP